jgi:XTP/dITP diphosphohydrolase
MPRTLSGKIVIATHNEGKLREMRDLLAPFGLDAVSAGALGLPEPDETGTMFAENAAIKAHAAAKASGLPALADDSGVCIDALDGAPGLFTADWAGRPRDFGIAFAKVERELSRRGVQPNGAKAHFVSALVVAWPDGEDALFEGRVHGSLAFPPRGTLGFGYDPFFVPEGETRTFGEMDMAEKHGLPPQGRGLSHRARAFMQLAASLLEAR